MIELVVMMLAGKVNKEIVNLINTNGGNAIGLCGVDNMLWRAQRHMPEGVDLGLVGEITSVNVPFINLLVQNGMMPVIAPIGVGENGQMLNVNADVAAGAVATALKAEKLVYLSDIEGVIVNKKLISTLTRSEAKKLMEDGSIFGGMIPKIRSAFDSPENGVK